MIQIGDYRARAAEFCEWAVGGADGVTVDSAPYVEVTEGRDPGPRYSSCGDLAHAMLFELGVRANWINRRAHLGFRFGVNVARLCRKPIGSGAGGCARAARLGERFETGDVLIVWRAGGDTTDAHVLVVDTFDGETLRSWDYGQGPMSSAAWASRRDHVEGCRRERRVTRNPAGLYVLEDGRSIQSVLPLADVLHAAHAAGELFHPTGGNVA